MTSIISIAFNGTCHSPEWDPILWEELRGSASHAQESKARPLLCQTHVSLLFSFAFVFVCLAFFFLSFFFFTWPAFARRLRQPNPAGLATERPRGFQLRGRAECFSLKLVLPALVFSLFKRFSRASACVPAAGAAVTPDRCNTLPAFMRNADYAMIVKKQKLNK